MATAVTSYPLAQPKPFLAGLPSGERSRIPPASNPILTSSGIWAYTLLQGTISFPARQVPGRAGDNLMTSKFKNQIYRLIDNGFHQTYVGYHRDWRNWGGCKRRGCFAQIDTPDRLTRIYAHSYEALLIAVRKQLHIDNER
jgi:hypothetical protein